MSTALHPSEVLYAGGKPFSALAACEHYAGSEKLIRKALDLQAKLGPIFDVTADCEDGAPAGLEREHAAMIAALIDSAANRHDRVGARIHPAHHPLWQQELDILLARAGHRLAYLVLPKAESCGDVETQIAALETLRERLAIARPIPVHVLIETPGALHEVWQIAQLPRVESLDFGLMDFVSAHHGAIPESAMRSPGQFSHPLIVRAKCEIAAAALGNGIVPAHNVTTEFRDPSVVAADARRAREEFGYLRMWSIHPNQIEPIVAAMQPKAAEIETAAAILCAAQEADWGPIQCDGRLHDRASYRYHWELLQRAHATGVMLPPAAARFFSSHAPERRF
ncbi:HpcH/HpaI aldolase/citrate lyase family protein [Sulfuricystis multivorans]|uniref:HpcH/HpaI aldolase/citrate lyase family protein n=1 Tax=Sulfuricystis multivorans TaxID=2211108 RepID=UPI000F81EBB3|nr:aldolase/citrate lyase family protein [Sulfuricystis multivorans]